MEKEAGLPFWVKIYILEQNFVQKGKFHGILFEGISDRDTLSPAFTVQGGSEEPGYQEQCWQFRKRISVINEEKEISVIREGKENQSLVTSRKNSYKSFFALVSANLIIEFINCQ